MESNTKKIIDEFFNSEECTINSSKVRGQIDRKELYDYEEKIGKTLFEMEPNEIYDMLNTFSNNRNKKSGEKKIAYNTLTLICGHYRKLFNWYIDNKKVIKNPFNSPELRGSKVLNKYNENVERITKEDLEKAIIDLHAYYDQDNADYLELIMLLYYDGFYNAECIVMLKEEDINFETNEVHIHSEDGRVDGKIKIKDRTMHLLKKFNKMDSLPGTIRKKDLALTSYRGGYYKFVVERKNQGMIDDWDKKLLYSKINQNITKKINENLNYNFNYRKLYLLGFYDFMVEKVGAEHANALIYTLRNKDYMIELENLAKEYGLLFYSTTPEIKRALKIFV